MNRCVAIGLWLGLWAHPADAAFPNGSVTFVAVARDAASTPTARSLATHARERLGLRPEKVHALVGPTSAEALRASVASGPPFRALSRDDVAVVYLVGAGTTPDEPAAVEQCRWPTTIPPTRRIRVCRAVGLRSGASRSCIWGRRSGATPLARGPRLG